MIKIERENQVVVIVVVVVVVVAAAAVVVVVPMANVQIFIEFDLNSGLLLVLLLHLPLRVFNDNTLRGSKLCSINLFFHWNLETSATHLEDLSGGSFGAKVFFQTVLRKVA